MMLWYTRHLELESFYNKVSSGLRSELAVDVVLMLMKQLR